MSKLDGIFEEYSETTIGYPDTTKQRIRLLFLETMVEAWGDTPGLLASDYSQALRKKVEQL